MVITEASDEASRASLLLGNRRRPLDGPAAVSRPTERLVDLKRGTHPRTGGLLSLHLRGRSQWTEADSRARGCLTSVRPDTPKMSRPPFSMEGDQQCVAKEGAFSR